MSAIDLTQAVQECRDADSILVTTHTSPDGDAIGSVLAVRHFLAALGKTDVTCACHDPVPRNYDWLPGAIEITEPDILRDRYDLTIIIDVAQFDRVGSVIQHLQDDQRYLVLDHHREESPCGTVYFLDYTYASASEIVIDLFEAAGLPMTPEAATCVYVGLTTDTGSFRFGNTNVRAHRNAIKLIEAGIDASDISARVFDVMSLPKGALLQRVLKRLQISDCARYAWSHIEEPDLHEVDAMPEDVDGLVNFVRNFEGIQVGMLFRELGPDKVKVSLRSRNPINCAEILQPLGGGGHAGAAGATLHVGLAEAKTQVISRVEAALGSVALPK